MKVDFEGRQWQLDDGVITLKQGVVLHMTYGLTVSAYLDGLKVMDARSFTFLYWLMLQQNDKIGPIADADCDMIAFASAWADAKVAEQDAEDAAEAEAAVVPTSPPPGDPPSPESGTPTDTIPPLVQPQALAVPTG